MEKWYGSSAICINDEGKILMVLQGKLDEKKKWSVPSGGLEQGETFEECCVREVEEETGYMSEIIEKLQLKKTNVNNINVEVHYYLVKIVGGQKQIQDPDGLIYDIGWISLKQLDELDLSFPEDRPLLEKILRGGCK